MKGIIAISICIFIILMIGILIMGNCTGAANYQHIYEFTNYDEMNLVGHITFTESTASDFRKSIDDYGDGNGTITNTEVDNFESELESQNSTEFSLNQDHGQVISFIIGIKGATGNSNDTSTITIDVEAIIKFPTVEEDLPEYSLKYFVEDDMATMNKKFTIPTGYTISDVQGLSNKLYSNGDRTVEGITVKNTDIVITYAKKQDGGNDSPGFETTSILVALIATGIIVQKRTRDNN